VYNACNVEEVLNQRCRQLPSGQKRTVNEWSTD